VHKGLQDSSQKQRQDHKRAEMAEQRRSTTSIQKQYPANQTQMNKQFFGEASDKKLIMYVQNTETGP